MNRSKGFLLALIAFFGALTALLVLPFVQYVLFAILLAYVLAPLQQRLERVTRPSIAAGSLVALAIAGFVVPVVLVVGAIADDATSTLESIDTDAAQLGELEIVVEELLGIEVDLVSALANAGQQVGLTVVERSTEAFGLLTHALIGLGLALFLLYYLLKDGARLLAWLRRITPLPPAVQDDLYEEIDDVMWAVLIGHVLIAIVQGFLAGLGLLATGVPNAAFWTTVMMILALVPLVGAFLVWGPASVYLLLTNQPILAVALFLYSVTVVSISDDYLRPVLVDRYAQISPAVIILGVLGGLYAFGVMGLFYGPVVIGALAATLQVFDEHYDRLDA